MKLRKPTQLLRRVLSQELGLILDAEPTELEVTRRVQIFVPESPQVFLSIDTPSPLDVALNRTYQVPAVTPNVTLEFQLQPQQRIFGMVGVGQAILGVLVEYKE